MIDLHIAYQDNHLVGYEFFSSVVFEISFNQFSKICKMIRSRKKCI